jgi:hypothetical protein
LEHPCVRCGLRRRAVRVEAQPKCSPAGEGLSLEHSLGRHPQLNATVPIPSIGEREGDNFARIEPMAAAVQRAQRCKRGLTVLGCCELRIAVPLQTEFPQHNFDDGS